MINFIYYIFFFIITFVILLKTIGYGLYEIKEEKNTFGGICIISISLAIVIFANIMFFIS